MALDGRLGWDAADVSRWLQENDLGRWQDVLRNHHIDGPLLIKMNEESLADLGVDDPADRRRMAQLIAETNALVGSDAQELDPKTTAPDRKPAYAEIVFDDSPAPRHPPSKPDSAAEQSIYAVVVR